MKRTLTVRPSTTPLGNVTDLLTLKYMVKRSEGVTASWRYSPGLLFIAELKEKHLLPNMSTTWNTSEIFSTRRPRVANRMMSETSKLATCRISSYDKFPKTALRRSDVQLLGITELKSEMLRR